MSILRKIFNFLVFLPVVFTCGFLTFSLPSVILLRWVPQVRTAFMWQADNPFTLDQHWVPLSAISPALKKLVVGAEDGTFYEHHGVNFDAIREAWTRNQKKKRYVRGGSTISMQLAKNLYLFPYKSIGRKAVEVALALEMETLLPKDRILELYLNVIEWGPGIYGAEAASRYYFKKPAADLTTNEAAFLAAIIPNPKKWGRWPPGSYVKQRMKLLQLWQ